MKRIITLGLAMGISAAIFAQQHRRSAGDISSSRTDKMKTELALTDEQYSSIKNINEKFAGDIARLRQDTTLGRQNFHDQIKNIRKQREREIELVLDKQQKDKWKTIKDAQKERAHKGNHIRRGHGHRDLKTSLSLTEEQSAMLDKQFRVFKEKSSVIRSDAKLSDEQKKEKLGLLRAENERVVQQILNQDQFKKWKEIKKMRPDRKKKLHKRQHFRESVK
jgi:hypothetical protein